MQEHHYQTKLRWTGNQGNGTQSYTAYSRNYQIFSEEKESEIFGSADPFFRGDPNKINPEEMLLASLSACHMLWYLHLCSVNKVIVTDYTDQPTGIMEEYTDGSGQFREVTLHPQVIVQDGSMIPTAKKFHQEANRMCFIASSCNFPIRHQDIVKVAE